MSIEVNSILPPNPPSPPLRDSPLEQKSVSLLSSGAAVVVVATQAGQESISHLHVWSGKPVAL